jgi:hypothetical protein
MINRLLAPLSYGLMQRALKVNIDREVSRRGGKGTESAFMESAESRAARSRRERPSILIKHEKFHFFNHRGTEDTEKCS